MKRVLRICLISGSWDTADRILAAMRLDGQLTNVRRRLVSEYDGVMQARDMAYLASNKKYMWPGVYLTHLRGLTGDP